jgi:hypothetical protein
MILYIIINKCIIKMILPKDQISQEKLITEI